jgi:hypothetical protein
MVRCMDQKNHTAPPTKYAALCLESLRLQDNCSSFSGVSMTSGWFLPHEPLGLIVR